MTIAVPSPNFYAALLAASEISLALSRRSKGRALGADQGSLRMLWAVILLSLGVAIFAPIFVPEAALPHACAWCAPPVFLVGAGIRWASIRHLGDLFTVDVSIGPGHRLIDTGPYRYVRHPSYAGLMLEFFGLALSAQNAVSLLAMTGPPALALMGRIGVEESALRAALGDAYLAYERRTKRLIPGVY